MAKTQNSDELPRQGDDALAEAREIAAKMTEKAENEKISAEIAANKEVADEKSEIETPEPEPKPTPEPEKAGSAAEKRANLLVEALKERQYDVTGFDDDDKVLEYFENLALRARNQQETIGRLMAERQKAQEPAKEPEKTVEEPEKADKSPVFRKWERPTYDENWEAVCEYDPAIGRYIVREPYRSSVKGDIADKLTDYKKWEHTTLRSILQEFPSQIRNQLGMPEDVNTIEELIEKKIQERLQAEQVNAQEGGVKQYCQQWMEANSPHLYVYGPDGNVKTDPITGNVMLTPAGTVMANLLQESYDTAEQLGVKVDDTRILRVSIDKMERLLAQAAANKPEETPAEKPEETNERQKEGFLKKAVRTARAAGPAEHTPDRGGSVSRAIATGAAQNPDQDLRKMMLQEFQEAGLLT